MHGLRSIDDINNFRKDISPFLAHLTRDFNGRTAKENLSSILDSGEIRASNSQISDVRFGGSNSTIPSHRLNIALSSVSFTETPIEQMQCLVDIKGRDINLSQYGLVFLKKYCVQKGVNPVVYINNASQWNDSTFEELYKLMETAEYPGILMNLLPLVAVFEKKVKPPNAGSRWKPGNVDFTWEREWRLPAIRCPFRFSRDDVFVGLCPGGEIEEMENKFGIKFIDPLMNPSYFATKLVELRRANGIQNSVV